MDGHDLQTLLLDPAVFSQLALRAQLQQYAQQQMLQQQMLQQQQIQLQQQQLQQQMQMQGTPGRVLQRV
ncbi:hypothetical protein AK812_SmicGene7343 [Symbiodinium microadriaticum]|uniref:Uncharacterized protein n=1 Tax=Symbiodinium microadriaticum TaxID=2951 RepID=A0A1Q9ENZ4_SYMMI|nr:hypothetical protein AK812_SmicGene7343 [Symbiodinium microadriaticum]